MVWIAIIIGIILIFIFPKQMGVLAAVLVAGIVAIFLYFQAEENDRKRQNDAVSITVNYDKSVCSAEYPIVVNFRNGSRKTVTKISWNIGAFKPGYSNNVVDYGPYSSEYSTPYESDKILAPNQAYGLCYKAPSLKDGNAPASVSWRVVNKDVTFQRGRAQ